MSAARIAGAPISWGVCEVPGWGTQLPVADVLADMRDLGLAATEFGPDGFLPADPGGKHDALRSYGLRAVGGFLPVVLHTDDDPRDQVTAYLRDCVATGADVTVLAAATGADGYEGRPHLDEGGWTRLLARLDEAARLGAEHGIEVALHPHVGTMVESRDDVERVLAGSSVGLCLDTGHLLVGGTDPVDLARAHAGRITHVHLKDVDRGVAERVRAGDLGYAEGVRAGLYTPLGDGDVEIGAIVSTLGQHGYAGWYVLEQDVILEAPPTPSTHPRHDVRRSLDYLRGLVGA